MNQQDYQSGRKHLVNPRTISFLVLCLLWLGNSGLYTPLLLMLGGLSVLFVSWLAQRMAIVDAESHPFHLSRKLPGYYLWLLVKIVQGNLAVVKCVWRGNSSISPCQARLPCELHSDISRVIYANSITLTPGTVAMDMGEDGILIHALTASGRDELLAGEMQRRIAQLED